jgi:phosphatidylinositol dimannoside acyltransferase
VSEAVPPERAVPPGRATETPRERVAYWTYRSAEALGAATPDRLGRPLARILGDLGARMLPGVRMTVAANQARVLGVDPGSDLARVAAREAFELYARYWYDTFRVRAIEDDEVLRRTTANGLEHIDAALEDARGVICALPHTGNWDAAGRWLSILGYRIAAVAEVLRPPRLFELFLRHREELGMRIVPLAGGTGRPLRRLLAENWIVALVADRDLTGRGIEVEMFGAPRRIPAGPALLALSSGAPLVPCALYTTPTGWHVEISPPVDAALTGDRRADATAITNAIACHFERVIAAHPADWHLFQPGWPA